MGALERSVDILHDPPLVAAAAVKDRRRRQALTFAFARGIERDHLLDVTEPQLTGTSFDQRVFAHDLFITDLVDRMFRISIRDKQVEANPRYFTRLLTHPPKDESSVRFRQAIHEELENHSDRVSWLENAYLALVEFRDALCGADFNQRSVGVRRRIDILAAYRNCLNALFRCSASSTSGLSRIASWVEDVQTTPAHEALVQLLDFEGGRSVLETRLQAGYDGTLRRFEIVRVTSLEHKSFPRGPAARFFRSILSLLRGYRFSEEDVMSHVLDDVFSQLEDEVTLVLGLMHQIEFYLRADYFRRKVRESGLSTCGVRWTSAGEAQQLSGLFNPWLLAQSGSAPVPCDVQLDPNQTIVIITGPNSGGKTRLLQSLAVAQLLAQVGLPIPARQAELSWVRQLYLSMIEHVSADQAEGRLGLELMRIRQVFETSGKQSLILMDELCSGTNPSEGERIFEMVLELLRELGARVWITTHFLDFAQRIFDKQGTIESLSSQDDTQAGPAVSFLQVELDSQKRPTYKFVPGVAETSLARNTAARLGVTREELRDLILSHQDQDRPT